MNNRKQNKDPKMKIYTGKKVFEPVMMDFIEQLQKAHPRFTAKMGSKKHTNQ